MIKYPCKGCQCGWLNIADKSIYESEITSCHDKCQRYQDYLDSCDGEKTRLDYISGKVMERYAGAFRSLANK